MSRRPKPYAHDSGTDVHLEAVRQTLAQVLAAPTVIETYPMPIKRGAVIDTAVVNPLVAARPSCRCGSAPASSSTFIIVSTFPDRSRQRVRGDSGSSGPLKYALEGRNRPRIRPRWSSGLPREGRTVRRFARSGRNGPIVKLRYFGFLRPHSSPHASMISD